MDEHGIRLDDSRRIPIPFLSWLVISLQYTEVMKGVASDIKADKVPRYAFVLLYFLHDQIRGTHGIVCFINSIMLKMQLLRRIHEYFTMVWRSFLFTG